MSLTERLDELKELADKVMDSDEHKDVLKEGAKLVEGPLKNLLAGLRDGDREKVQSALTKWEDVNRTLEAIGKMDEAIERAQNAVSVSEVLEFIGKAAKVGITIGMAI